MKSALYIFEGPDGVGKTSLASLLNKDLNDHGLSSELLSFPGHEVGTLGEHIYRLYHDPGSFNINNMSIISEQLLFTAAHADVIEKRILPTLSQGTNVVLDRYWWSTWVYSTFGNLNSRIRDLLIELELTIWHGVKPQCIFLVLRERPIDSEFSSEQWRTLVDLYNFIGNQQAMKLRIINIDNTGKIENSFRLVQDAVKTL